MILLKNKKGFVLTETLMVAVFIIGIFTFLYTSILPLVGTYDDKVKRENDIDIVYKLHNLRNMLYKYIKPETITNIDYKVLSCSDFTDTGYCETLMNYLELKDYDFIYTKSIKNNYSILVNNNEDMKDYLKKYQDSNDEVLLLHDKTNHTIAHLKYSTE